MNETILLLMFGLGCMTVIVCVYLWCNTKFAEIDGKYYSSNKSNSEEKP